MLRLLFLLVPFLCMAQNTSKSAFAKAESLYQSAQYTAAKPLLEKVLKRTPNNLEALEYLGDIAGYAKDWDTAIPYYKRLVELQPKVANYHFKYGGVLGMKALEINRLRALSLIGDIKEAFETAAKLDQNHIETRWALVELYMQLPRIVGGSESKSRAFAEQLSKISPVDGFLAYGYIAEYNDNPEEAERNYKQAVNIGGSITCYEKLRSHYEKNNEPEKAFKTAYEAQQMHSKENRLQYQLGKVAAQYGIGLDDGIVSLLHYIKYHTLSDGVPKDWAYLRLAQIYKHKGNKQEAQKWIGKALASRPDFKEALKEQRYIYSL